MSNKGYVLIVLGLVALLVGMLNPQAPSSIMAVIIIALFATGIVFIFFDKGGVR